MIEENKNKIFWLVFVSLLLIPVVATFVRIFIYKDYFLVQEVFCDPEIESCFVHTVEDLCYESEDLSCIQNTSEEYYKIIHKKASSIEGCNPQNVDLDGGVCSNSELSCGENESLKECYYEHK